MGSVVVIGGGVVAGSMVVVVVDRADTASARATRRSRSRAIAPATAEQAAPTRSVPVSPRSSIRMKPARMVPTMAPKVLAAYSRPNASDILAALELR